MLKVFGYSNLKIFFILATTSFVLGWLILVIFNPITSSLFKYYEKTKSNYSRDIDHLVTFNKNGLWIKENLDSMQRIIYADKPQGYDLVNVTIFHLNEKSNIIEKIYSERANIEDNLWKLKNVTIFKPKNKIFKSETLQEYEIVSIYNFEKINSLLKKFNTMSFLNLVTNYDHLLNTGYNKKLLNENLHSMISSPFFYF